MKESRLRCCTGAELDAARWDLFVEGSAEASAYHRYAWKRVLEETFRHRARYLAALDGSGGVQGVLPLVHMKSRLFGNFLVSLPFVNYGGLLCRGEAARQTLLDGAGELRRSLGAAHVELRHCGRAQGTLPAKEHKVTMILPLAATVEAQWQGFNPKLRNQIRKAQKSGLSYRIGGAELLDDFYAVFARNMRDLGTPVYAREFFGNVLAAFPDSTRIFAVGYRGTTIAAGIASWYRDTVEVPWASSIGDYRGLCPNNMLYWEAIRFAVENGFTRFDFGRSTPNEGTFNFKKQWGAQPVPLYWQYLMNEGRGLPALDTKNPKYDLAIRLWKRLPLAFTSSVGPHIVRSIP